MSAWLDKANHLLLALHQPPPPELYQLCLEERRRLHLSEPELRPWRYLGSYASGAASAIAFPCPCMLRPKDSPPAQNPEETIRLQQQLFMTRRAPSIIWLGQCSLCRRIHWLGSLTLDASMRRAEEGPYARNPAPSRRCFHPQVMKLVGDYWRKLSERPAKVQPPVFQL